MSAVVDDQSAQRVAAAACTRLLRASRGLTGFSGAACLISALMLWVWAGWLAPRFGIGAGLFGASFCAGVLVAYYGFRLRLDAELFALLDQAGAVSDQAFAGGIDLFRAQLRSGSVPAGSLGLRYAGALRLWRRWAAAVGLQLALLAGAMAAASLAAFKLI